MINDILDLIQGEYDPVVYNSIHTLVAGWPPEVVDRLNYEILACLASHLAYVVGKA